MVCPDCGGAGVEDFKGDELPKDCETCQGIGVISSYKLDGITLTNTQLDLEQDK